ncbi:uncharacterized protein PFL1_03756 [Pseudozyma flocculosa PF-1]|uniref:Myb-like domain-containing protein n=2 Tax=Pseudozyma flocculosa TaxID=84751 RepID=A0A5C3EZG3_9BASI|nr:uncharacterized protein PFL1_03756 [Pseudozyma flocculosa PF-1]EPQ28453.1 hypothetical protein PFL1_03756 [Pseudozyma flocculosa PF-1]SPO36371.1 uncharacterized protein PSFLO_01842 [Pseudozyma flocculosa]
MAPAKSSSQAQPWTAEEVKLLFNMAYPRASPNLKQLAEQLGRSQGSCKMKLHSMRTAVEDLVASWGTTAKDASSSGAAVSQKKRKIQPEEAVNDARNEHP